MPALNCDHLGDFIDGLVDALTAQTAAIRDLFGPKDTEESETGTRSAVADVVQGWLTPGASPVVVAALLQRRVEALKLVVLVEAIVSDLGTTHTDHPGTTAPRTCPACTADNLRSALEVMR